MSAGDQWYLRVPEGQVYGPVDKATLDQWVQQGRADAQCFLGRSPGGPWEPAGKYYPHLATPAAPANHAPPVTGAGGHAAGGHPVPAAMPGKLEAVRVMAIVGGALAILNGLLVTGAFLLMGIASAGLLCLCLPLPLYWLVAGVVALMQGLETAKRPPRTAAIMQIVCIISGDVINLVLGILELSFLGQPEVRAYYRAQGITY